MPENQMCTLDIQADRPRSISPLAIARCREFICDLSRRFSRKSHDGVIFRGVENDCEFKQRPLSIQESRRDDFNSNLELHRLSSEDSNCSDCENTDITVKTRHRRSSSAARTARKDFTTNSQTHQSRLAAISNSESAKKGPATQKKILRQPVSYTYLKGMSGLPTQRVPRAIVCSQYPCRRRFLV